MSAAPVMDPIWKEDTAVATAVSHSKPKYSFGRRSLRRSVLLGQWEQWPLCVPLARWSGQTGGKCWCLPYASSYRKSDRTRSAVNLYQPKEDVLLANHPCHRGGKSTPGRIRRPGFQSHLPLPAFLRSVMKPLWVIAFSSRTEDEILP